MSTQPKTLKGLDRQELKWLDELRSVLPLQNPLHSFVHNNMLMAWEKYEFWDATAKAAKLYGARFPNTLDYYQSEWKKGRFADRDVLHGLKQRFPELPAAWEVPVLSLLKDARDFAADPLLRRLPQPSEGGEKVCQIIRHVSTSKIPAPPFRAEFSEWFCLLCESFLDQGMAHWPNPFQKASLREFAISLLASASIKNLSWRKELLNRLSSSPSSEQLIVDEMHALGLDEDKTYDVILQTCFAFKGWMGLINKLEREPDWFPFNHTTARLTDGIAILLIARRLLKVPLPFQSEEQAQTIRFRTADLQKAVKDLFTDSAFIEAADLPSFLQFVNQLGPITCGQILHEAFEKAFHDHVLNVISSSGKQPPKPLPQAPHYQILTCMDDREESLRRHLEDISPKIETFGVLGNFNLDMKFLAWDYPTSRRQCPPVVAPRRTIIEKRSQEKESALNYGRYRTLRSAFHARVFRSAGSLWRGFLASTLFGPFSAFVLFVRILAPKTWARFKARSEGTVFRRTPGEIMLQRDEDPNHGPVGYTLDEQADIVASVLKPLCAASNLAPVVLALGHQATTSNNPYQQAYGCGACSGNSGQVNSRVFCLMANAPLVREKIKVRYDFAIPASTLFVPAVHDTTADRIELMSTEKYEELSGFLTQALQRNALERVPFFESGERIKTGQAAIEHVRFRAWNLAEPRPEYGHSRVALAIFGKRELTKGVCLDRRGFLVSYDRKVDDANGTALGGLIHGALPVAANIGLDYFFSAVDPHGFGAGSKLPLNISALVGTVSGSRGDIRIGLATQMVELHEPVRVLAIIQAEVPLIEKLVMGHARLNRLVKNGWMKVIACSPDDGSLLAYTGSNWQKVDPKSISPQGAESWQENTKKNPAQPWSDVSSLERIWHRV